MFITRKGRAAIQGVEEELEALDRRMLEGFSPEEEARAREYLRRMYENLSRSQGEEERP